MKKIVFFLTFLMLVQIGLADINDGLIAHWSMNETSGATASDSAGTAVGTLSGFANPDAAWTDGALGGALELNGSCESVIIPGIAGSSAYNEITIAAWVRLDSLTSNYMAIYNSEWTSGGIHFQIYNNTINMTVAGTSTSAPVAFANSKQWYHVTAVYSNANVSGTLRYYINGTEIHNEPIPEMATVDLSLASHIGAWNLSGSLKRLFDGTIDDVRIYNRALSATEIGTFYDPGACSLGERNKGDYESNGVGIAQAKQSSFIIPTKQFYRMSFWRAPQNALADSFADLAWKHGLAFVATENKWGDSVFYQLMRDYTIDLTSYFKDYTRLPHYIPGIHLDSFQSETWREVFEDWVVNSPKLLAVDSRHVKIWSQADATFPPFFSRTMMTIKKGYRWDGPTINLGAERIAAKPSTSMRASLVHDVFYDMMRLELIQYELAPVLYPVFPTSIGEKGSMNRAVADCLFYMIIIQDGYETGKAKTNFDLIREYGAPKTHPNDPETYPFWKEFAIADAGPDQYIDCAPATGVDVTLDGSGSAFATTFNWTIVRPGSPDLQVVGTGPTPTIHLEPGIHTITVNAHEAGPIKPPGFSDIDAVVITVSTECSADTPEGDINGDGKVNMIDFAKLAENWLVGVK